MARPETYAAYRQALAAGAGYIELDVRQTADGTLVAIHEARLNNRVAVADLDYASLCDLARYEVPRLPNVLALLAGQAGVHLDLKEPGSAAEAAAQALEALGPAGVIATTRDQAVAAALGQAFPALAVGLTVGGDLAESLRYASHRARTGGMTRLDAVVAAGARWVVLHRRMAGPRMLRQCRDRGLHTMVWTVNTDRGLTRWLADPDTDVVVTDRPARAAALHPSRARSG
jgi:glycerophosphoryl diester phosphodiesterase